MRTTNLKVLNKIMEWGKNRKNLEKRFFKIKIGRKDGKEGAREGQTGIKTWPIPGFLNLITIDTLGQIILCCWVLSCENVEYLAAAQAL